MAPFALGRSTSGRASRFFEAWVPIMDGEHTTPESRRSRFSENAIQGNERMHQALLHAIGSGWHGKGEHFLAFQGRRLGQLFHGHYCAANSSLLAGDMAQRCARALMRSALSAVCIISHFRSIN